MIIARNFTTTLMFNRWENTFPTFDTRVYNKVTKVKIKKSYENIDSHLQNYIKISWLTRFEVTRYNNFGVKPGTERRGENNMYSITYKCWNKVNCVLVEALFINFLSILQDSDKHNDRHIINTEDD